uniref:LOW QUALITY PROTEIN: zinc finger protein-like 1 n=1 Tax=Lonchura striata TaxID=40157 RepID=UPI0012933F93|nr:LOW QUALITY PROTEIN: zinc finger protein-like 1 [Lonchura striata domestica]
MAVRTAGSGVTPRAAAPGRASGDVTQGRRTRKRQRGRPPRKLYEKKFYEFETRRWRRGGAGGSGVLGARGGLRGSRVPLTLPLPPDVFHWPCLAAWARALPPSTAPAGHRCPQCGGPLFPPPNLQGPVAEALRARLRTAPWARPGLGLPLIEDSEELPEPETSTEPDGGWDAPLAPPQPPPSPPAPHAVVHMGGETPTLHAGSAPRKPLGGREARSPPDHDEDKYRRRPLAWLPPKLRCRARGAPRRPLLALCLGGAAAFALLLLLLASLGRGGADSDPALEPLNNPHVRVGH